MGAAGLTCSTVEMASKGRVGMTVDLDRVPMREGDMSGYELMLSESQERMLAVAHRGREGEVLAVFEKWGLPAVVVGEVTEGSELVVSRSGEVVARLDPRVLTDECPVYASEAIPGEAGRAWRRSPRGFGGSKRHDGRIDQTPASGRPTPGAAGRRPLPCVGSPRRRRASEPETDRPHSIEKRPCQHP